MDRDFFRSFFFGGFPHRRYSPPGSHTPDEPSSSPNHPLFPPRADVFTGPLEMERYFNDQMDRILRGSMFGPFFSFGFEDQPSQGGQIMIMPPSRGQDEEENSAGSRDFMLKDDGHSNGSPFGYDEKADSPEARIDKDLDDQLQVVPRMPPDKSPWKQMPEFGEMPFQKGPRIRSFGSSSSTSYIRRPDGSVEERSVERSSDGHEKTRVTTTTSEGETHTVTTIRRPDGTQEVIDEGGRQELTRPHERIDSNFAGTSIFQKFFGKWT